MSPQRMQHVDLWDMKPPAIHIAFIRVERLARALFGPVACTNPPRPAPATGKVNYVEPNIQCLHGFSLIKEPEPEVP